GFLAVLEAAQRQHVCYRRGALYFVLGPRFPARVHAAGGAAAALPEHAHYRAHGHGRPPHAARYQDPAQFARA
nr:hypothetical protein [Tanacetum cinerariifolium]